MAPLQRAAAFRHRRRSSRFRVAMSSRTPPAILGFMDPLQATIEEFAAEGYTHIECQPRISLGLTIAQLSARLRRFVCGGLLHSVKPWRQTDVLEKPLGRRG